MQIVVMRATKIAMLQALIDHALAGPFSGPLDGLLLGLATDPAPTVDQDKVLADYTEATFSGYARSAGLTWGTIGFDPAGACYVEIAAGVSFQMTALTVGAQTATVLLGITPGGSPALAFAGILDAPVNFARIGDMYDPPLRWTIQDPLPFASQ